MLFRKRGLIVLVLMLSFALLLAACGNGGDNEGAGGIKEQTWKFVTEEWAGDVQYEYAREFAERMSEKTDGKITIDVYEYGGLGDAVDQVEQLQAGAVEMAIISPGFTGTMVNAGQIFALQFLFPEDLRTTQNILNTSEALNVDLAAQYEEHDIKVLSYFTEGAMLWTSSSNPLTEPADFEGFKMRTQESPLIVDSYKQYGADPTAMDWGEIYTSLEQGIIEGQENPVFFIEGAGFHEVSDHMTVSNHNNYVAMMTVNPNFYAGLDDNVRTMFDATVDDMQEWIFANQTEQNEGGIDRIGGSEEHPTEIHYLTDEQREAFRELAIPMREYFKTDVAPGAGADILDKLVGEIEAAQ